MNLPGYEITRDGRIKGPSGRWLTPETVNGLHRFRAYVDRVAIAVFVHYAVCETYHGPRPTPDHVPVHIDGNPLNNHADNLRWGTRTEARKARGTDKNPTCARENHHQSVLTEDQVRAIRQEYAAGNTSQQILGRKYGVSSVAIHKILHNTVWHDPDYTPPSARRKPQDTPDHPATKLTREQVQKIRKRYAAEKIPMRTLATDYGVSAQTVSRIIRNDLWYNPAYTPPSDLVQRKATGAPRGNRLKGEQAPTAKLTWAAVRDIRKRYATGDVLQRELAEMYGVSPVAINKIIWNLGWVDESYTPPER